MRNRTKLRFSQVLLPALCVAAVATAADNWSDTFYPFRVPLRIEVPAAGAYLLDLDPRLITDWINEADVFGFRPEHFAHDNVRLCEVDKNGNATPLDAGFCLVVDRELVTNGGFERITADRPEGWQVTHTNFVLRQYDDGSGWYMSALGGDRNACIQTVPTAKHTWYRYASRFCGYNPGAPQIMRVGKSWQPVYRSWFDPYLTTSVWREVSYLFYTGDKSDWQNDTVQVRFELFDGAVDDISVRECRVGLVAGFATPGKKELCLYYAPLEGVMPSPPTRRADSLPPTTLAIQRTGPVETFYNDVAYRLPISNVLADVWAAASVLKVLPDAVPPRAERDAIEFACARNEAEAMQVILRPKAGGTIDAVSLELVGPNGTYLPSGQIEICHARYVPILEPSQADDNRQHRVRFRGRLPDPLPEFRPVTFQPGDPNIILWADVKVPSDAPAGLYAGSLRVTTSGGVLELPVRLTVWDFALPDRSSCATSLGFTLYANQGIFPFHKLETQADKYALSRAYLATLAKYRISAANMASAGVWRPGGPGFGNDNSTILNYYSSELPWAFDELHVNGHLLNHVTGAVVSKTTPEEACRAASNHVARAEWLRARGWLARCPILIDEPQPRHFAGLKQWIDAFRELPVGREVKMAAFVYNAPCYEQLRGVIDILCPVNNDGDGIVSPQAIAQAAPEQATWFYYTRTAHMWIDAPAIDQRLWAPKIWAFGGTGFHVWGINVWRDLKANGPHKFHNPWLNPLSTWGNGATAFFYPPSPLGVDLPAKDMTIVPSLRLLLTRDGIEDFEYAVMLEQRIADANVRGWDCTKAQEALTMLRRPFATPRSWAIGESYWLKARKAVAEAIVELDKKQPEALP